MKAEHLDEQPSITNTDDKVLSKLSQHWLKIIEGIADAKGGQEALDQYFTNKIKEAELRIFEVCERNVADPQIKTEGYFKVNIALLKQQLTNQYKGEQDDE